jgi:hypothetical protein
MSVPAHRVELNILMGKDNSPPVMKITLPERFGMALGLKDDIMLDEPK